MRGAPHVALSGGSGLAGLRVAAELLDRGHRLTLLTRDDPEQARRRLLRRLLLIGHYPVSVQEFGARLTALRIRPELAWLGLPQRRYRELTEAFDAVWCARPDGARSRVTVGALLPLAGGARRTAFHYVGGPDTDAVERLIGPQSERRDFPAAVFGLTPLITDLADHPELPRHRLARLVAALARTLPDRGPRGRVALHAAAATPIPLLPVAPAAAAMVNAVEPADWWGTRVLAVTPARAAPLGMVAEAVGRVLPLRITLGSAPPARDGESVPEVHAEWLTVPAPVVDSGYLDRTLTSTVRAVRAVRDGQRDPRPSALGAVG